MTTETRSLYSQLPAIDRLLRDSSFLSLRDTYGHTRVVELLRQMLDEAREVIRDSQTLPAWCENWAQEVDARLTKEAQSALRPVINLTGTVLHTNLGRALQAEAAVEAVTKAMRSPVTLEYDLDDAGRGHRDRALAQLLCRITGAEDACIVNNNAAAVLLMLAYCQRERGGGFSRRTGGDWRRVSYSRCYASGRMHPTRSRDHQPHARE